MILQQSCFAIWIRVTIPRRNLTKWSDNKQLLDKVFVIFRIGHVRTRKGTFQCEIIGYCLTCCFWSSLSTCRLLLASPSQKLTGLLTKVCFKTKGDLFFPRSLLTQIRFQVHRSILASSFTQLTKPFYQVRLRPLFFGGSGWGWAISQVITVITIKHFCHKGLVCCA